MSTTERIAAHIALLIAIKEGIEAAQAAGLETEYIASVLTSTAEHLESDDEE